MSNFTTFKVKITITKTGMEFVTFTTKRLYNGTIEEMLDILNRGDATWRYTLATEKEYNAYYESRKELK